MERIKRAFEKYKGRGGALSISMSTIGGRDYREFSERLDMLVEAGMDQFLLITFHSEIFRLAEIAPAEQMMVKQGVEQGKYPEMFIDTVKYARERYPELPIIVTPMIGDAIAYGITNFVRTCKEIGVDGMDTAQYAAIEDLTGFRHQTQEAGMGFICAVNGGAVRLEDAEAVAVLDELVRITSGELFYVPAIPGTVQKGMKGSAFRPYIEHIRTVQKVCGNSCPIIGIGGISNAEQAYELVRVAGLDGVHFSSAFMKQLFAEEPLEKIEAWLKEVKKAMKGE